jgi:predicted hydrocarbon binding protein
MTLSGLYYPNKMGRILLMALEEVLGKNGLNAMLNHIGLTEYMENYPPENLERKFDFAHLTGLNVGLEEVYGVRGARGLALRAGRACFTQGLKNFGALAGAGDLAFKVLPLPVKLKLGFPALAQVFDNFSDQITQVQEFDDHYLYMIKRCPVCWDRHADRPVCHFATGILQEGLRWVSGGLEFRVAQTRCHAMGEPDCAFVCYKQPTSV